MSNTMFNMKTATIREVQHGLSSVLRRVQRGEEITITKRGKAVAKVVPVMTPKKRKVEWPDFSGRMKRLFPDGPPPGKPTSEIVMEMREDRF